MARSFPPIKATEPSRSRCSQLKEAHMKKLIIISLLIFSTMITYSQNIDSLTNEILKEGLKLYNLERIAWVSTDLIVDESQSNLYLFNGYLAYEDSNIYKAIYYDYSSFDTEVIFTAICNNKNSIENINTKLIKERRKPTEKELQLITIKEKATEIVIGSSNLNRYSHLFTYNLVISDKDSCFDCYLLPGSNSDSIFYVGGDYCLTLSKDGELLSIVPIHNGLLPMKPIKDGPQINETIHTHIKGFSQFITPSEICQFKLYSKIVLNCTKHKILATENGYISVFDSENNTLEILPYSEYEKRNK